MNSRTTRVKNSVDVKMTADCIECAHTYPNIGTYVLVSGDSDFIHVINSLRAIGKRVIIIGVSWSTSRRLADQVDGLILYDIDVDPETQPEPAPAPTPVGRGSRTSGGNRQQLSDVMRVIEEIVRSERQAGRTPLLTSLKQRIMRRVPGFDEKKLGFSGFKKLMLKTAEEGNIQLVTVGLVDWVIMADEPIPEEALPETGTGGGAIESVAADEEVIPEAVVVAEAEGIAEAALLETDTETPSAETIEEPSVGGPSAVEERSETATGTPTPAEPLSSETGTATEAASDAAGSEESERVSDAVLSPQLEKALEESLAQLELPRGPGDGQDGRRITDLVIMADMLEHQEGITHVAFNFLLGEICGALQQGLEAEHPEITGRWGGRTYSRTYVTRLLRELGEKDVFIRGWHQDRDEETGRSRRFRTFNLNRAHPLVKEAVVSQWGPDTDTIVQEPEDAHEPEPETEPAVEPVQELDVSSNDVEAEAEEVTPAPRAQASRRRGRQRQTAEEVSQSSDQASPQSQAETPEEGAGTGAEEAPAPRRAPASRRRGRQRQTAEEVSQSSDQVTEEPGTEVAGPGASEEAASTTARPSRRRGRQRQPAGDAAQSPDQASETPEPEPVMVAVAEDSAPDAEPAPAAVD